LVKAIRGAALGVTDTVEQILETPVADAQAVLAIVVTPAGRGLTTATAKGAVRLLPAARVGRVKLQAEPAAGELQLQAGSLFVGSKVVLAGTVSRTLTRAAPWLPVFWTATEKRRVVPGVPSPEARVLVTFKAGRPFVGMVTVWQSSGASGDLAQAVLATDWTPAGSGLSTTMANLAERPVPAWSAPKARVQVEPAAPEGRHCQAAALAAGEKVVLAGTFSERVTFVAPWLPVFWRARL
jgi:hypothetical protein